MAGHSKWAQIKRQKGAADAKRGVLFSKLANQISLAARSGADPEMNFQLRIAIDHARAANMPKENIQRAIDKATGANGVARLEEIVFEAYGPAGIAFLIETATDNRNRTTGEIRAALNKLGGKLAESGSVSYLFEKRGELVFSSPNDQEALELAAIEAGAEDIVSEGGSIVVYSKANELESVRQNLITQDFTPTEASLVWQPKSTIEVTDEPTAHRLIQLSETLEEIADVSQVTSNFDIAAHINVAP